MIKKAIIATVGVGLGVLGFRLLIAPVQIVNLEVNTQNWLFLTSVSGHVHAISSCIFMLLALVAIFTRKGAEGHRIFGKIGVAAFLVCTLSAGIMLTYIAIANGFGVSTSMVQVKENISILLIMLMAGFYAITTGYRWSVLPQPKLDLDWAFGVFALLIAMANVALIPFVGFINPILRGNATFPFSPFSAVMLLTALAVLYIYFGIDDLRTYYANKPVQYKVRVQKHIYRIMVAPGAGVTAVAIVHVGALVMRQPHMVWTLFFVPPVIFFALTLYLKKVYLDSISKKVLSQA